MPDHEGHLLGCDGLGSDDEIAFILAVLGVENNDEVAVSCGVGQLV